MSWLCHEQLIASCRCMIEFQVIFLMIKAGEGSRACIHSFCHQIVGVYTYTYLYLHRKKEFKKYWGGEITNEQ